MTREEQINEAINTYMNGLFEDGIEIPIEDFENIEEGFIAGAAWADNHPKSSWIDVSIDLPCNHEELVHDSWYTEQVFVRIVAKNGVFLYTTNAMINVQLDKKWKWTCGEEYKVTHWMPIPKIEED